MEGGFRYSQFMRLQGSGVAELKDRIAKQGNLSFVEKAELCTFGRNFTAQEWSREYSPEELVEMWKSRDSERLHEVALLAEAKGRLEGHWSPRRGDLEVLWKTGQCDLEELRRLIAEVDAIFYGYDLRVDAERIAYYERYGHETFEHQQAASLGYRILNICYAALHPVWLAVLCFSRRTKPVHYKEGEWGNPLLPDWIPQDGVETSGGEETFARNDYFSWLELLTDSEPMTTGQLKKRLDLLGIGGDLKSIREAAEGLGVDLLPGARGPKSGSLSPKRKTKKPRKRGFGK